MITHDEFRALCAQYQDRPETRGAFIDYVRGQYVSHRDLHCAAGAVKTAMPTPESVADMDAVIGYVGQHWKAFD
ncbi:MULTISPECIES: hypothetical protein [Mycobacteriaceae]|uniref:Uncharacterized protein n=1 Tax=Mycolicibacterium senegalense TaxID=1796 RepID=A0ABR5FMI7_9MYCO|nr:MULTISPECIES: hypothetical protein [Mycolicibacterium]KLI09355.1 hypothetical protein AA982_04780 [Mycolicibacterium senegalense]KLO47747.1 hypothetical protein ABW05_31800 [Mycolicibacterium senegalense]OMB90693.1 hypothetical protein A5741_11760 [Mycolicibacterium conceptionense]